MSNYAGAYPNLFFSGSGLLWTRIRWESYISNFQASQYIFSIVFQAKATLGFSASTNLEDLTVADLQAGLLTNCQETRSLGLLRGPTSSWRPFGPAFGPSGLLDFVLHALWALRPCDPRLHPSQANTITRANTSFVSFCFICFQFCLIF